MTTELLARDDIRELTTETTQIVTAATSFKIATNVTYELAADELKRIKGVAKRLDELRKTMTKPLDDSKKAIMDFFRNPAEQLEAAERSIKSAMQTYLTDLERKRQEEERIANALAREEQERLQLAAAKAVEQGSIEEAQEIVQQMTSVVPAAVVREMPKVSGISSKETWLFEITNAKLIPREYLLVDETKIRKMVGAFKGETNIPGVRVYSEKRIASGAA